MADKFTQMTQIESEGGEKKKSASLIRTDCAEGRKETAQAKRSYPHIDAD